ncbi:B12-binding domain-containing radical SAM protein [Granulicella sp. S190]|uniref:B12-binding domain-containing radical SAM protein n=1 Tax=Granulicella sp. S190 TaxID=1747226 RepID=UPI00131C6EAC|nr:radical SAM protein [Granulicella sp. S190]
MLSLGKVVLFYPPYDGPPLGAPLCLLALAASLREANFDVVMIDAAIEPNYLTRVECESVDALCVGISVLTGPMIRGAVEVATMAKSHTPWLPIIFGGWHPSLLPDETLSESFVDMVVRGQGERTLVEVAQALAGKKPLNNIAGLSWKNQGKRIHNGDRKVESLNSLPIPAFDLVDFDAYEKIAGIRKLAYATSVGCPYACNYCTDMVFYKRRFNALSADRTVAEMIDLVTRYRIEEVALLDSNFPVQLPRALEIAQGILDTGIKFKWTFQASTDFLCRMTEDEVRLLGASGVSHMGFGTESTSEAVLKLMNKRHQRVDEMYETARKAQLGDIRVTFNLIFGYPGETEADRIITFQTMSDIGRQFPNVSFSPNIFTPYPGIPIWPQLRELGVSEPKNLREWMDMPLGANMLPWLKGKELARLQRMLKYFLLNSQIYREQKKPSRLRHTVRFIVQTPIRWRLRSSNYYFPWELWLSNLSERIVLRRSLVTGQELPKESANAC